MDKCTIIEVNSAEQTMESNVNDVPPSTTEIPAATFDDSQFYVPATISLVEHMEVDDLKSLSETSSAWHYLTTEELNKRTKLNYRCTKHRKFKTKPYSRNKHNWSRRTFDSADACLCSVLNYGFCDGIEGDSDGDNVTYCDATTMSISRFCVDRCTYIGEGSQTSRPKIVFTKLQSLTVALDKYKRSETEAVFEKFKSVKNLTLTCDIDSLFLESVNRFMNLTTLELKNTTNTTLELHAQEFGVLNRMTTLTSLSIDRYLTETLELLDISRLSKFSFTGWYFARRSSNLNMLLSPNPNMKKFSFYGLSIEETDYNLFLFELIAERFPNLECFDFLMEDRRYGFVTRPMQFNNLRYLDVVNNPDNPRNKFCFINAPKLEVLKPAHFEYSDEDVRHLTTKFPRLRLLEMMSFVPLHSCEDMVDLSFRKKCPHIDGLGQNLREKLVCGLINKSCNIVFRFERKEILRLVRYMESRPNIFGNVCQVFYKGSELEKSANPKEKWLGNTYYYSHTAYTSTSKYDEIEIFKHSI